MLSWPRVRACASACLWATTKLEAAHLGLLSSGCFCEEKTRDAQLGKEGATQSWAAQACCFCSLGRMRSEGVRARACLDEGAQLVQVGQLVQPLQQRSLAHRPEPAYSGGEALRPLQVVVKIIKRVLLKALPCLCRLCSYSAASQHATCTWPPLAGPARQAELMRAAAGSCSHSSPRTFCLRPPYARCMGQVPAPVRARCPARAGPARAARGRGAAAAEAALRRALARPRDGVLHAWAGTGTKPGNSHAAPLPGSARLARSREAQLSQPLLVGGDAHLALCLVRVMRMHTCAWSVHADRACLQPHPVLSRSPSAPSFGLDSFFKLACYPETLQVREKFLSTSCILMSPRQPRCLCLSRACLTDPRPAPGPNQ